MSPDKLLPVGAKITNYDPHDGAKMKRDLGAELTIGGMVYYNGDPFYVVIDEHNNEGDLDAEFVYDCLNDDGDYDDDDDEDDEEDNVDYSDGDY